MNSPNAWSVFDQLQHRDRASLTRDECLVLALGEIRTEVNHGGFDFYFRYRPGRMSRERGHPTVPSEFSTPTGDPPDSAGPFTTR